MFQPKRISRSLLACALALAGLACAEDDPDLVASNCADPDGCLATQQPLERIDAVDILLVVDNSGSAHDDLEAMKQQLPRMLNALVTGDDEGASFPPAASVHVAVATSDMGLLGVNGIDGCAGSGDDGVFVRPGQAELSCETTYPGYLAFEGGPAALATVDSVSCVPSLGADGCGFEQPLEASLKALWPASDDRILFAGDAEGNGTRGHGGAANEDFLRDDSLLVVIIVTDEDDGSARDLSIYAPNNELDPNDPWHATLLNQGLNVRASVNPEAMHDVERYVAGLKALRAEHPDRVIFAAIAGFPNDLVVQDGTAISQIEDDAQREQAYDALLADPRMQPAIDERGTPDPADDTLQPSCGTPTENGRLTYAPIRLAQVARGFGRQGVLGSLCGDDYGSSTGMLIRTIGMRLTEAANGSPDAGRID